MTTKDGGWGWVVVFAAFIISVFMDGIRYSFGILFIEFHDYFGGGKGFVGWIGGVMFGLLLIAAPISGFLINKFGCRLMTISGSLLVSGGFVISVFATSIPYLCLSLGVLGGLGFSMLFMSTYMVCIQYFEKKRSLAIGLVVSGSGLGGFAFNPLTKWLLDTYAWRGTLLILAGILLNGVVCGAAMRPFQSCRQKQETLDDEIGIEMRYSTRNIDTNNLDKNGCSVGKEEINDKNSLTDSKTENLRDEVDLENKAPDENISMLSEPIKEVSTLRSFCTGIFMISLLRRKRFLLFILFEIFINMFYMVPFIYVPDMVFENLDNVTRNDVIWIMNAMSIANVVSRIPIGIISDKKMVSGLRLMFILCTSAGVSCAVMPFCHLYGLLMAACIWYSISIVSAMVLIPVVLSELFGDTIVANSFGLSLFFGGVAGVIGSPFAGWIFDLTHTYEISFLTGGVTFVLGGVCLVLIPFVQEQKGTD